MNTKLSTTVIATALVATVAFCGVALGQTPAGAKRDVPSEVVRYSDLDLSTAAGVRALYGRIRIAAWRVCRETLDGPTGIEDAQCRYNLVDQAVAQLNKPALTALHRGKRIDDLTAKR